MPEIDPSDLSQPKDLTEQQVAWLRERRLHPVDPEVAMKNVATRDYIECDVCHRSAAAASTMHHVQFTTFSDKPVLCEKCVGAFIRYGVLAVKTENETEVDMYATENGGLAVDGMAFSWG